MAIPLASLCKNLEMFCPADTEIWPKMHIYGKVKATVKVIHKGHRIFASARRQTLLSMYFSELIQSERMNVKIPTTKDEFK